MGIIDILKSTAETLRKADKIEEFQQILSVQEKLLEMQKKILDLEEENKGFRERLRLKEVVFFEHDAYWIKKDDGSKDGPFCLHCWDKDQILIRMQYRAASTGRVASFNCTECKYIYLA
jgi:DNA-directed RNA polymerase subunit M/transcription elongation factor TFIIS